MAVCRIWFVELWGVTVIDLFNKCQAKERGTFM
jgi:hypothetical protein